MKLLDFLRPRKNTAQQAKERLQIIVSHQRYMRNEDNSLQPFLMEQMKNEILEVVQKYVRIEPEDVNTDLTRDGEMEILALSINLADKSSKENVD